MSDNDQIASGDEALTPLELETIGRLGRCWNDICQIVDSGPTRDADLNEAVHHVHALQHMIMAQAAARMYPDRLRLLGSSLR